MVLAGNYGIRDHDFALLCLVDYVQTPCRRDAPETGFQFHLAPNEETRLEVSLASDPGTHDVLFLTFYDPTNHSPEQVFRQESRFLFSFHRVQIVVGESATRPSAPIAQSFSAKSNLQPGAGFFTLSREKFTDPSQAPWHSQAVAIGAPLEFLAAYSNPEQVKRTVGLMAFVDFEQVAWDASHKTFFAEVDPGAQPMCQPPCPRPQQSATMNWSSSL